jgi:hypothetical protein
MIATVKTEIATMRIMGDADQNLGHGAVYDHDHGQRGGGGAHAERVGAGERNYGGGGLRVRRERHEPARDTQRRGYKHYLAGCWDIFLVTAFSLWLFGSC